MGGGETGSEMVQRRLVRSYVHVYIDRVWSDTLLTFNVDS